MPTLNTERLKECREKLGISKLEAAKRINVSQPAYVRYESGQRNPSIQVINEMAIAFGTSVDYLTGESDSNLQDTFVISRDSDLFEIVSSYESLKEKQQRRLLEYFKKMVSP